MLHARLGAMSLSSSSWPPFRLISRCLIILANASSSSRNFHFGCARCKRFRPTPFAVRLAPRALIYRPITTSRPGDVAGNGVRPSLAKIPFNCDRHHGTSGRGSYYVANGLECPEFKAFVPGLRKGNGSHAHYRGRRWL